MLQRIWGDCWRRSESGATWRTTLTVGGMFMVVTVLNAFGGLVLVVAVVMLASFLGWMAHWRKEEDIEY